MNSNQALWEKGDFTAIAAFMRESGETVVESLGVRPPLRALDLGCVLAVLRKTTDANYPDFRWINHPLVACTEVEGLSCACRRYPGCCIYTDDPFAVAAELARPV